MIKWTVAFWTRDAQFSFDFDVESEAQEILDVIRKQPGVLGSLKFGRTVEK